MCGEVVTPETVCSGADVAVRCRYCRVIITIDHDGLGKAKHLMNVEMGGRMPPPEFETDPDLIFFQHTPIRCSSCHRTNTLWGYHRHRRNGMLVPMPSVRKDTHDMFEMVHAIRTSLGAAATGTFRLSAGEGALVLAIQAVPQDELTRIRDDALAAKAEGTQEAFNAFFAAHPTFQQFVPKNSADLASWVGAVSGLLTLIATVIFGLLALGKDDPKPPQVIIQQGLSEDKVKELIAADREQQLKLEQAKKNKAKAGRRKRR